MYAKKSFGQHFLKDESIAERISDSLLQATLTGQVLEVGPGMGMLTKYLLKHPEYQTTAVEADQDMVEYLGKNYPELAQKHLIFKDFLDFDAPAYFEKKQFCLIGNYPYNISSQILFKLLDWRDQIPEMVGMFQKEVADRIVSKPGSKVYGITSVLAQAFFKTELLFIVKPGAFNPPPKVVSAVIRLTRKEGFSLECDEKLFRTIVKTAFGQRRKMLRNTLKNFLPGQMLMEDAYFEKRPETLGWEEYVVLTNRVSSLKIMQ
ncbi:MAG: 16S rRNA (adenine(1518)-N(6)/adenine(1519)-N(6))-dimethyltransferase RsmA [Saprospiraceae bacterium]